MKNLKALTLATLTSATAFAAPAAKADAGFQTHANLFGAVERAGVRIFLNDREVCDGNWGGGMYATNSETGQAGLMICQDNGEQVGPGNMAPFTANDLDTLRHEAHHVVQDCLDGGIADGKLIPMFEGEQLKDAVVNTLSVERIEMILKSYDEEDHLLELEAFTVAAAISPEAIAGAIDKHCTAPSPKPFRF